MGTNILFKLSASSRIAKLIPQISFSSLSYLNFTWSNILISFDTYRYNIHDSCRKVYLRIWLRKSWHNFVFWGNFYCLALDNTYAKRQQIYCPFNIRFSLLNFLFPFDFSYPFHEMNILFFTLPNLYFIPIIYRV